MTSHPKLSTQNHLSRFILPLDTGGYHFILSIFVRIYNDHRNPNKKNKPAIFNENVHGQRLLFPDAPNVWIIYPTLGEKWLLSRGNVGTWRIIPVSKWLVTPIYKPFRPFGRGLTPVRGLTITMVINHLRVMG